MRTLTPQACLSMKQKREKITMLTAYDASFAHLLSSSGVDILFIGDSLGSVIQGQETTIPVQMDDVMYHTHCVAKGNQGALLIADMPFMSYYQIDLALANATQLMQAGAHMVKLEGGVWLQETVAQLVTCGIPVCAHLGLTPQSVYQLGGHKVQGREASQAQTMCEAALALQAAGASLLVLECVPRALASEITEMLTVPTIGIGAGPDCDGQVLVTYDMLGLTPGETLKLAKNFLAEVGGDLQAAIAAYVGEVKSGDFPTSAHSFT